MHGTKDVIAEPEDSAALDDMLRKLGHRSELIMLEAAKHAFVLYDYQSSDQYAAQIVDEIFLWIRNL